MMGGGGGGFSVTAGSGRGRVEHHGSYDWEGETLVEHSMEEAKPRPAAPSI